MPAEVDRKMVERLTRAYIGGLDAADRELGTGSFEQRLARTALAENAIAAVNLLETRTVTSKDAKQPLSDFVTKLDPKEGIRPVIEKVDTKLNAAVTALAVEGVKSAIGLQAAWWFTAVVGLVTGALLLLADIGAGFALFLLGGGGVSGFLLSRSGLIINTASQNIASAYNSSMAAVNGIGAGAELLVKEHIAAPERDFYALLGRTPPSYRAIETVRSYVHTAVISLWCLGAVAGVAVLWGFLDVLSAASQ